MSNVSDSHKMAARKLFCTDLEDEIKPYLQQMQTHIKAICRDRGYIYPMDRPGRGKTGLRPNIAYAVHYMIKGLTPFEAAQRYFFEQKDKAVLPQPQGVA